MEIKGGKWYSYKALCAVAKAYSKKLGVKITGRSLCDKVYKNGRLSAILNGGYGCNILEKLGL